MRGPHIESVLIDISLALIFLLPLACQSHDTLPVTAGRINIWSIFEGVFFSWQALLHGFPSMAKSTDSQANLFLRTEALSVSVP